MRAHIRLILTPNTHTLPLQVFMTSPLAAHAASSGRSGARVGGSSGFAARRTAGTPTARGPTARAAAASRTTTVNHTTVVTAAPAFGFGGFGFGMPVWSPWGPVGVVSPVYAGMRMMLTLTLLLALAYMVARIMRRD